MAIDAAIPLGFHEPSPVNPLAQYGEVLGIQNAQQAQQAGAQKIQSNALELQQQQRQADYQKAFTSAIQKHTTQNQDGSLSTDMGGVQGDITNAGFGPEAIAMNKPILEAREAALKLQESQHTVATQKLNDVANTLAAIPRPDPAKPDPSMVVSFNAAFPAQVQSLLQKGTIDPQTAQQYMQIFQSGGGTGTPGWSPQLGQTLNGLDQSVMAAQQRTEHGVAVLNAAREAATAVTTQAKSTADTAKTNQEMADKQRSDAAAALSQATSATDYDAKLAKVDPKIAAQLPASKDLDFSPNGLAATQERVLTSGMNAEQVAQHQLAKTNSASLIQNREAMQQYREDMLDFRRELKEGKPSPGQAKASTQIGYNEKTLGQLSKQAGQLATALKGIDPSDPNATKAITSFVNAKGEEIPMATHLLSQQTPGAAQDAINDMAARLNAVKAQMKSVVNKSHDLMDQYHGSPTQTREEALGNIDAIGPKPKAQTQTATPAAKPAAAPAAPAPAKPSASATPAKWKDKAGNSWESGQVVYHGSVPYKVTGFKDGQVKVHAVPVQP